MIHKIEVSTKAREELVDITGKIHDVIQKSGAESGIAIMYVPHTTAAITINENYDPSVQRDITSTLCRLIPHSAHYAHTEGNADAHIKAAIVGSSRAIFFENEKIAFGTWQGIFFCEFDGPRKRNVFVKIIKD
jgi:secondary thiamine-phosphate synthase enzyme